VSWLAGAAAVVLAARQVHASVWMLGCLAIDTDGSHAAAAGKKGGAKAFHPMFGWCARRFHL
jgi:hypothetical protein